MNWIFDRIEPKLIRELAKLDDEALKLSFYVLICDLAQGVGRIPAKKAKVKVAEALICKGASFERVSELTNISKTTYYKIKGRKWIE